jgi:hypothetical protein
MNSSLGIERDFQLFRLICGKESGMLMIKKGFLILQPLQPKYGDFEEQVVKKSLIYVLLL